MHCFFVVAIILASAARDVSASQKFNAFFQMSCATVQPNPCQQVCVDMRSGGFFCRCQAGYAINKDGMTCVRQKSEGDAGHPTANAATASSDGHADHADHADQSSRVNEDGEVVIHGDDKVVFLKSVSQSQGPPLQAASQRRVLKEQAAFVPNEHYYNIPHGKAKKKVNKAKAKATSSNDVLYVDSDAVMEKPPADAFVYYDDDDDVEGDLSSCDGVICGNNGTCVVLGGERTCQCPLGTAGDFCERLIEVRYPKFYGDGYLALPILRNGHKEFWVSVEFRPESSDGLLLFSGEHNSGLNDFISVTLEAGFVVFRFDCGTGPAVLKTPNRVILDSWNRLVIRRVDTHGSVQLNGGHQVEGSSQGDYSRITFRLNLYVGGYSAMDVVGPRVGTSDLFVGCVQELVINGHTYDLRQKGLVGESEFGLNVGECSDGVCHNVVCENGGQCTAKSADSHICLCPVGFHGDNCEKTTVVHIPHFAGHSYLEFPGLNRSVLSFTEIEVVFKPTSLEGAIFYNGFSRDRKGDFISLALRGGHLEYRFDLGTGPAVIRSYEPLELNRWHVVKASRTGLMGSLTVDGQLQVSGQSTGAYTQLTLTDRLYVGGHPNFDHTSKHANLTGSFTGCLQKVVVNKHPIDLLGGFLSGRNIEPCPHPCAGNPCMNKGECVPVRDAYVCRCPLGYEDTNCEVEQDSLPHRPMFGGQSYLLYDDDQIVKRVTGQKIDLQLSIRPKGRDGLIFWSGEDMRSKSGQDFVALGFNSGALHLRYDLGSGEAVIGYNDSQLFDGNWHTIRVQRNKQDAYMEINNREIVEGGSPGQYTSLNTDKTVYLGGMPDVSMRTGGRFTKGFKGCIRSMKLATDYDVKLLNHAQKGRNIVQCRKKFFQG